MLDRIILGYERDGPLIAVVSEYYSHLLLSDREIQYAELIAEGISEEEIAQELRISPQQVSDIKKSLKEKAAVILRGS
ncbi:MAG: hypothetical protein JSV97_03045 [candidate division WOR-3 bacterium]|nr:MAG: hypothetical protein JSV97_03045 [candidate division WOR-3 bacterium]